MRRTARFLPLAVVLLTCARSVPPPAPPPAPPAAEAPETVVVDAPPGDGAPPPPTQATPDPVPATADPAPAASGEGAPADGPPADEEPDPLRLPATLRVGLATDLERVDLPCCRLEAAVGGRRLADGTAFSVLPGAAASRPPVHRVQVAALKDEEQARGLAAELGRRLDQPAEAVFDAGSDLYRVRVGRYRERAAAEEAQRRLATFGVDGGWIATEPGLLEAPALVLVAGAERLRVPGRWIAFTASDGDGVEAAGSRYRGRLLVYLNDRGRLNLVNELGLDDYLRGVVPREMGPELYPSLEALKAQTVAARTYTVRNLAEFAGEGYDICASPRCQVYGGMAVEHPLSDQAVAETAGEVVVWRGELADTLYSAACGGHTEDGGNVFATKGYPYLRGVPCLEAGGARLPAGLAAGTPFPEGVTRRLLPPEGAAGPAEELGRRLAALARRAGAAPPSDRLASLAAPEVRRYLASTFDLALDLRLLGDGPAVAALAADPPPEWGERHLRLAAALRESGALAPAGILDAVAGERLLYELAVHLGVLEPLAASFHALEGDELVVAAAGRERRLPVVPSAVAFRAGADGAVAADLELAPGDPLAVLLLADGSVAAVVQRLAPRPSAPPPAPRLWTRVHTDARLASLVRERYPGLGFRDLEIVDRGASGRVSRLRLAGADGRAVTVEGLAVRWTLDLPDTWFDAERVPDAGGAPGWRFRGRGWGHGVGMCQTGAYGMGRRGVGYRQILRHYYSGVEVVRVESSDP